MLETGSVTLTQLSKPVIATENINVNPWAPELGAPAFCNDLKQDSIKYDFILHCIQITIFHNMLYSLLWNKLLESFFTD